MRVGNTENTALARDGLPACLTVGTSVATPVEESAG